MSSAPPPLRKTSTSAGLTLPALSSTLLASISAKMSLWRSNRPRWMYLRMRVGSCQRSDWRMWDGAVPGNCTAAAHL
jgi:hypothetical protein